MINELKLTFSGGQNRNNRIEKADGIKKPLELQKQFLQENSNWSYFPIGSSCQPWLVQAFFYWLHETAACCYFGVDQGTHSIIIQFPA